MERFEHGHDPYESHENLIERDEVQWCYEKEDGKWKIVSLPKLASFDPDQYEEKERRTENWLHMIQDTSEEWGLMIQIDNITRVFCVTRRDITSSLLNGQ